MNRQRDATPPQPGLLREAISLRLALLGFPLPPDAPWTPLLAPIFARELEQNRRLAFRLSPTDARIQRFLTDYLAEIGPAPNLPQRALSLDQPGLARGLSLPADGDRFTSSLLSSYRLRNGILHNPANDRRTTAGVFHVAEGGLPIPDDKKAVPKAAFARLLALRADAARGLAAACPSRPASPTSRQAASCRCCCGRWSCPRCPASPPKSGWRSASSRPGALVSQPRFRREHLRQRRRSRTCRRTTPSLDPGVTGPATPAA